MNHKLTGGEHSVLFFNQFIDVVILHPNVFLGGSSVCLNCQPLFISQSDSRGFAYLSFFTSLSNEKLLIFNILQDDFFPSIILEVKSLKSLICILGIL